MEFLKRREEMIGRSSHHLNEYQKLVVQMHDAPKVVVDNAASPSATVVEVGSARDQGLLLESVQALIDLDLDVGKAYFSSDNRWFMNVFHVTDRHGRKLRDDSVVSFIEESLAGESPFARSDVSGGLTVLELSGADRPGLFSEVFAVLADLKCRVHDAKVWTHNGRVAAIVSVKDDGESDGLIQEPDKIHRIESRLSHVLQAGGRLGAATAVSAAAAMDHASDRRLHQMLAADRDYQPTSDAESSTSTSVSVDNLVDRGYSVVSVRCRDRPKLLFDILCTLTDMEYSVFHGSIATNGDEAHQEFYIRHSDGSPISSEAERQRVIQCLQAAIHRRSSEGLRLELRTRNRPELLSDVTRAFRENGLRVRRAEMSTEGEMASIVFYVTDMAGGAAGHKAVDTVRQRIGAAGLQLKEEPRRPAVCGHDGGGHAGLLYMGSLVMRNLCSLGLIRSLF